VSLSGVAARVIVLAAAALTAAPAAAAAPPTVDTCALGNGACQYRAPGRFAPSATIAERAGSDAYFRAKGEGAALTIARAVTQRL